MRHVTPLTQPPAWSPVSLRALGSGLWACFAGADRELEVVVDRIRGRLGARSVLLTDSGTSALTLALKLLAGGREGAAVALPAFGCFDLATAAQGAGVDVVLYDVDPRTLGPAWDSMHQAIRERGVIAVVAAHLYGIPVDMDRLSTVAREAGVAVVEDAAQGVGGSLRKRPLGAWGPISVLSFGRGKGLTGGGGGALVGVDQEGPDLLAGLEEHPEVAGSGWTRLVGAAAQWALGRPGLYALPAKLPFLGLGETIHHPPRPVAGMSPAALAVLAGSWDASLVEARARRTRAGELLETVERASDLTTAEPPEGGTAGYLRLPVLATTADAARRLGSVTARRLGIMPSYPRPLHRLPGFEARTSGPLPGAEHLASRLFTAPVHGRLQRSALGDIRRVLAGEP